MDAFVYLWYVNPKPKPMSMTEQRFQSFITRVRPHRVAVLTNIADAHWQESCLGIIEYFTKLWGGTHCIIVPTDGQTIDETFWAILSSHDPDSIYRYQRTGEDERIRDPEKFAKDVAAEVTRYANAEGCDEEQIRDGIEKAIREAHWDEWNVSDELRDQLLMRLAPFHFEKMPLQGMPNRQLSISAITRGSNPNYPFTTTVDILQSSKRPKNFAQIVRDVDADNVPPPLWLAAAVGGCDEQHFKQLKQLEIEPYPVLMSNNRMSQVIKWGISPRSSLEAPFPFGLTNSILTPVMATKARRFELPTVIIAGDTLQDFCLYHALYWMHGRALWLPAWFMPQDDDHYPERLMTAIREAEANGRIEHNERLSFVSYSVDKIVLEELKQKIVKHMYRTMITIDDITSDMLTRLLECPSRVYAEGNLGDVTTHLLLNNNLPGAFDSPLPRTLSPINPSVHRWLVDITFMQHLLPRHPAMGQVVVTGPNVADVRTSSEAVTYMCPGGFVMGNHMETNMLRPSIHVPDAGEIFRIVLDDCDYKSKTSDKGRYEDTTVRKFGGLDKAGYALWSNKHRRLLMKFLDKSDSLKGVVDEGVYLRDRRRYMDFGSINKIMQSANLTCDLIDEYVEREIFYRGYIFLCENCSDAAWHSISEVDQTFTCRRCDRNQHYKHQHWRIPHEPLWFYKLDEMVYLALEHNGHVPLLTLNKLRVVSKESFLFCPELRITPKDSHKTYLEMDICCVANGKLCIGEAKSNDNLAGKDLTATQTAERYRDLALKMGASMVVFSTTASAWNETSVNAISKTFADHPHIEVKRWTSAVLYA